MREKGGGNSKLAKDNGREAERDNGTVGKTACKSGQAEVYCKGRRERARKGEKGQHSQYKPPKRGEQECLN